MFLIICILDKSSGVFGYLMGVLGYLMGVLGYLMGVLGYLMGVLGYLMGVLGYPMAWRRRQAMGYPRTPIRCHDFPYPRQKNTQTKQIERQSNLHKKSSIFPSAWILDILAQDSGLNSNSNIQT